MPFTHASVEDRFWAKVNKRGPNECWEWTGSKNRGGYGMFGDGKKTISVHREI